MTNIMDGNMLAEKILSGIKSEASLLKSMPGLGIVMAGNDSASLLYTSRKEKACKTMGFFSEMSRLPETASDDDVIREIEKMGNNPAIDGILVQLPLPGHMDTRKILSRIPAEKDVDGLSPLNMGKLAEGDESGFIPCTPKGIIRLLEDYRIGIEGKNIVIINHSNLLGKPLAMMFLSRNATVTVCHKTTKNLAEHTSYADILVTATGVPGLVIGEMIKKGAVVIDAGTSKSGAHVTGDVDFESAREVAGFITPVPGGVGPMTVAMLMENTIAAARLHRK